MTAPWGGETFGGGGDGGGGGAAVLPAKRAPPPPPPSAAADADEMGRVKRQNSGPPPPAAAGAGWGEGARGGELGYDADGEWMEELAAWDARESLLQRDRLRRVELLRLKFRQMVRRREMAGLVGAYESDSDSEHEEMEEDDGHMPDGPKGN